MTTASEAFAAIRTRLEAEGGGITFPLRFQGEIQPPLPDEATVFAFIIFNNQGSDRGPTSFGGGAGANLYRNEGMVEAYTFAPNGQGIAVALAAAETVAARLRSFRSDGVSCFAADVIPVGPGSSIKPPGLDSGVDDYQCAVAEIAMHFDQIG